MIVFQTMERCAEWAAQWKREGICATIGNFDGVHLGHQALVRQTTERAKTVSLVITFEPHPSQVLGNDAPPLLTTTEQRLELLGELGVDAVLLLPFTPELASLSAQEFLQDTLTRLHVRELCIGHDFRMGRDQADADALAGYAAKQGIAVQQVSAVLHQGAPVSSTRIRQALADGDLPLATAMLGRPHAVRAIVVHGEGRGGPLLGFPTANMVVEGVVMPKPAAYATTARLVTGPITGPDFDVIEIPHPPSLLHASITSFGRNPTFEGKRLTLETFILDFSADIYDQTLEVAFLQTLREEKKFSGPQELIAQLNADVETRRRLSR